jgi:hypothetical protein
MDKFPFSFPSSFSARDFGGGSRSGGTETAENATPLVALEAKEYLFCVLSQCHENRMRMYSNIWNGFAILMVLGVVGGVLYLCCVIRLTPEQKKKRAMKTKQLVLSKMREMKEMNQYTQPNGITFSPVYQNKGY